MSDHRPSQSERRILEDEPFFQSWMALNALGFILAVVVLCINDGEGWGRIAFLVCLAPIGISFAIAALAIVGVLLYVVVEPVLPAPRAERIPSVDLRRVGR